MDSLVIPMNIFYSFFLTLKESFICFSTALKWQAENEAVVVPTTILVKILWFSTALKWQAELWLYNVHQMREIYQPIHIRSGKFYPHQRSQRPKEKEGLLDSLVDDFIGVGPSMQEDQAKALISLNSGISRTTKPHSKREKYVWVLWDMYIFSKAINTFCFI